MRHVVEGAIAVGLTVMLLTGCVASSGRQSGAAEGAHGSTQTVDGERKAISSSTPAATTTPVDGAGPLAEQDTGTGGLPQGLDEAVRRDLGISPEQYLSDAAAAGRASDIAPELQAAGIAPDQIWLDGSTINVHAVTSEQQSLVMSLGATPTDAAPPTAPDLKQKAKAYDNLDNGTGWYLALGGNSISICSTGFNGFSSTGAPTLATAGHCLLGNSPLPTDRTAYRYLQSAPNQLGSSGGPIGTLASSTFSFGNSNDSGLVPVTGANLTPRSQVSTWNGSTVPVRGMKNATVGAPICKSGRTTGWTCGTVYEVNYDQEILGDGGTIIHVNSVATSMCMWHGDSGGPAMIGNFAVGINSSGTWSSAACNDGDGYSAIYPLGGSANSLTQTQPGWQLQVAIDTPVITSTVGGSSPSVSGTLSNAASGTAVSLYVDGSATPSGTASVASNGTWSIVPTGVSQGVHTVSVTASVGSYNRSSPSATAYVPIGISSSRLSGTDRSATSVEVSKAAYPDGAPAVYVAFGWNFPDALVAAPAAVKADGPVLLSSQGVLTDSIAQEIVRLAPQKIVVVGDASSISDDVFRSLSALAPHVERVAGADRYATSRALVSSAFDSTPVSDLYITTGANFPDALAASAAAAATGAPVLTIPGWVDSLDPATVAAITTLQPQRIVVVGGTPSVSASIYGKLATLAPTIVRYGGTSRYETSKLLAQATYPSTASGVYLAYGEGYADALAGSVVAGVKQQPLLITYNSCVPVTVTSSMASWHATSVTLVGGLPSLGADVAALRSC